jgi:hypothetical protein
MIMNIPYNIEIYDGGISKEETETVYDYVQNLNWHQQLYYSKANDYVEYKPAEGSKVWQDAKIKLLASVGAGMHRCPLASDEGTLKQAHLPVYLLWKHINKILDYRYEITGVPEGMFSPDLSPQPLDPELKNGWRVYVNATHNFKVWNSMGYAHRDNPYLDDDSSVTILYVLNKEWYPSWAGEFVIFPEDPEGATGDHQQHHLNYQQKRNFNIGWSDQGRIISPVPGRIVVFDSRCLHKTLPTQDFKGSEDNPSIRVVFRARLKK